MCFFFFHPSTQGILICAAACSATSTCTLAHWTNTQPVDTHTPHSESLCFRALRSANLTASCQHFPVYRNQPGPVGGRHSGDWQPRQHLLVYSQLLSRAATLPRLTWRRTVLARRIQKKQKKQRGIKTLLFVQADEWQAQK